MTVLFYRPFLCVILHYIDINLTTCTQLPILQCILT